MAKILKISAGILILATIIAVVIVFKHPIVARWLSGTARIVGRPVAARVYVNGRENKVARVFHVNRYWNGKSADYYLFYRPDISDHSKWISLNRKDNYAGLAIGTSKRDYDLVGGWLFQSETGAHFSLFTDDMKGYGADPLLSFTSGQIRFNLPVSATASSPVSDSIRIEL